MQDIGGCRAILVDVDQVRQLVQYYTKSNLKHRLHTNDDYMEKPKITGYRGVHLIYRYNSDKVRAWNSLKIEMQLRSQFQHAWATAVEIVGTFTKQALKSSHGEQDWLRFFALMGTALAVREGTPPVPGTPTDRTTLISELQASEGKLQAIRRLETYGTAPAVLENPEVRNNHYFLMQLDVSQNQLEITGYKSNQLMTASEHYLDAEKKTVNIKAKDTVLVSVDSLSALRSAYPNYFLDTKLFVSLVQDAINSK